MCEAQIASARSRLDRRINRIPSSKRSMKLMDLLEISKAAPSKNVRRGPVKNEAIPTVLPASAPVRPAVVPATRKTRAAPIKPAPKPAAKAFRGKKRPSDDGDKENEELNVPKKRVKVPVKAAPPTSGPAPARSTRAASKKATPVAPQVLSPKPNNNRPPTRNRRQR